MFVTAYDAYAVEAFELNAMDYLLKPIAPDKLIRVVKKIKEEISKNHNPLMAQLQQFEKILKLQVTGNEKIAISTADKIIFLKVSEIIYCEASGAIQIFFCRMEKIFLLQEHLVILNRSLVANIFPHSSFYFNKFKSC